MTFKKAAVLAAAAALCLIGSLTALAAADIRPVYQILYAVSPAVAQSLKPVKKSCTDNGIRMEVLSASVHDDTADICISMTDLEGDRIDETTDLFDSYVIRNSYDSSGYCSFLDYDETTRTATFLVTLQQMNGKDFAKDKITFSVSEFLSHKTQVDSILSEIDLSTVSQNPPVQTDVEVRGGSAPDPDAPDHAVFLKPQSPALASPADGISVSAVGWFDGRLRIQVYCEDILHTDNHAWISLLNTDGTQIPCKSGQSFWDEAHCGSYDEHYFDIPYESLGEYRLYGSFISCATLTTGNWEITFSPADVL